MVWYGMVWYGMVVWGYGMVWYITRVSWVIEVRHRDGGGEMGEDRAGIASARVTSPS